MTSSGSRASRKRCVQKLDFENCIVTSVRTKSKKRQKLRARITREIERADDAGGNGSEAAAPVRGDESPVLLSKKRKPNEGEEDGESWSETENDVPSSLSPVFKLKLGKWTGKSRGESSSEGNSSSCRRSSYLIEDSTQESRRSVKISSVESEGANDHSVDRSSDPGEDLNVSWEEGGADPLSKWLEGKEADDSLKNTRRGGKKNTLLGRLQKLLQKQASEKLLWQHQTRRNSNSGLKFVVVAFWNDELKFVLRCRSLEPEPDVTFLLVDRKWAPNVRNVRGGSLILLHPPWQKVSVEKPAMTVFLNIICLDVLDQVEETSGKNVKVELVPVTEFEKDPAAFVNSLFSFSFAEPLI